MSPRSGCSIPIASLLPKRAGRLRDFAFSERFGLAGGRCRFYQRPDIVQTDGGKVSRSTGVCRGIHAGCPAAETPLPADDELDFISGAHLLVSRDYLDTVGLMREDYFLYYEEVDWAFRRGTFALRVVPGADIFHRGGASIGSGTFVRAPSSFANYFNHRNRMWFVRRHLTGRSSRALIWSFAKALQVLARDGWPEASALMKGVLGLAPPRRVRRSVADAAARAHAFPPSPHGPLRIIYKFCIKIFGSISELMQWLSYANLRLCQGEHGRPKPRLARNTTQGRRVRKSLLGENQWGEDRPGRVGQGSPLATY